MRGSARSFESQKSKPRWWVSKPTSNALTQNHLHYLSLSANVIWIKLELTAVFSYFTGKSYLGSLMKQWLYDVFKIGCGVALGYVFLLVISIAFMDVVMPVARWISGLVFGDLH